MAIKTVTFVVQGVTCASCAAYIERALYRIDGVLEVQVNLATEKAVVEYINGVADLADLRRALADAGCVVRGIMQEGAAAGDLVIDEEEQEKLTARVHLRVARWVTR